MEGVYCNKKNVACRKKIRQRESKCCWCVARCQAQQCFISCINPFPSSPAVLPNPNPSSSRRCFAAAAPSLFSHAPQWAPWPATLPASRTRRPAATIPSLRTTTASRSPTPTAGKPPPSVVPPFHQVRLSCALRLSRVAPRRLEDPDSEETKEFVARQVELAETVLVGCPERENLRREITRLFDHPRHGAPFRRGNKYFYFHNTGLQAQSVLYMQVCRKPLLESEPPICCYQPIRGK